MRIRHLQTYLNEQHMLRKSSIDNLRNVTLGIDALYFLRVINGFKDSLSNAAESISPRFCRYIDEQCAKFESYNISLIFVFEGITSKAHKLFSSQFQQNVEQGWNHYVNGDKKWALRNFSQIANPCNSDLVYILFHYLKSKGVKCIYSPYLASAQLVYFYEEGMIDFILGPPSILLFNLHVVIINFVWKKNIIEWLYLPRILQTWNINNEQFLEACLLAGTEYCLTFPYLNLPYFNGGHSQFNFGTALEFIKQAPLVSYLNHFPNQELRDNHIEGYCICKSLFKFPVVMLINGNISFYHKHKNSEDLNLKFNLNVNTLISTKETSIGNVDKKNEHEFSQKEKDKEKKMKSKIEIKKEKEIEAETETETERPSTWNEINDKYEREIKINSSSEEGKEEEYKKGNKDIKNNSNINNDKDKIKGKYVETTKKNDLEITTNESNIHQKDNKENIRTEDVIITNKKTQTRDGTTLNHVNKGEETGEKKKNSSHENKEMDTSRNASSGNTNKGMMIPADYVKVVGAKFPTRAYYLMAEGLLSKKVLTAIALGEWIDNSHPLIDSYEYRDALVDLREYRCKMLGLVVIKLNPYFHHRKIKFWESEYKISSIYDKTGKFVLLDIELEDGLLWKVNKNNVAEEMEKQNIKKVDLQFVLKWHIKRERENISLIYKYEELDEINRSRHLSRYGDSIDKNDESDNSNDANRNREHRNCHIKESLNHNDKIKKYNDYYKNILNAQNQSFNSFLSLVYFMFLEKLGIFTKNCGVTLFGLLLSEAKTKKMDNTVLIIFELLKFGFLATQPLLPVNGKSYPKNAYTSVMNNKNLSNQDKKSVLLLSRIYSLYDIKLDDKNTYEGLIDFDLCAFSSVVKIIKKTLRQLLQACIANLLLTNMELIELLPKCLFTLNDEHIYGFFTTSYIMGVLVKYFLLFMFTDVKNKKKGGTSKTKTINDNNEESVNEGKCDEINETSEKNIENFISNEKGEAGEKKSGINKKEGDSSTINGNDNDGVEQEERESNEKKYNEKNEENDLKLNTDDIDNTDEKKNIKSVGKKKEQTDSSDPTDSNVIDGSQCSSSYNFEDFEKAIKKNFPSVIDPIKSLCQSIHMWRIHLSLIEKLENYTNVYNMVSDLKAANVFLEKKIRYVGLHKTKTYIDICESC